MTKKRNPFQLKNFTIIQESVSLPVTTDACIFGALTEFNDPHTLIDMGCGSGLLMFLMHQKYPKAKILGIDMHPESIQTVNQNILFNSLPVDRITTQQADWWDYTLNEPVDAIICNPPFFVNQLPSENDLKRSARHTTGYHIAELLNHLESLINENGQISLLVPFETLESIQINWLSAFDIPLYLTFYQAIQSQKNVPPHLCILQFSRCQRSLIKRENLYVYEQPGIMSMAAKKCLEPYLQERALK